MGLLGARSRGHPNTQGYLLDCTGRKGPGRRGGESQEGLDFLLYYTAEGICNVKLGEILNCLSGTALRVDAIALREVSRGL